MPKIIIIRHGETDHSLENRYSGFSDPPLNDKGVWQAERLAYRMRYEKVDIVYSSDLKRAHETAKIIFNPSTTLEGNGEQGRTIKNKIIEKISNFREMNFGIFEGLTHGKIIKKYSKLYKSWIDNPMKVKIPCGEEMKEFCSRVRMSFSHISSLSYGETIAVITHGGPIRVILCDALKSDLEDFWKIEQSPGALNIVEYSTESAARVIKMNDTSHLLI